jgi:hypothetical protein
MRYLNSAVAVALVSSLPSTIPPVFALPHPGRRPALTLRVVNEGGIPLAPLALARKETTAIFDHSGIDLLWLDCLSGRAEGGPANPCNRDLAPAEYWMRIVTRKPSTASRDMLGFTESDDNLGIRSAGVYYPAAVALAGQSPARAGEILAAAIAHEIGHLLLGEPAHSPSGIMCAQWSPPQFERIAASGLHFTADQASLLRDRIRGLSAGVPNLSRF